MQTQDWASLLKVEDERIEWKQSGKKIADVIEPICALANDLGNTGRPGYLLLGVSKDGKVFGVDSGRKALDQLQTTISGWVHDKVIPNPSFDISIHEEDGKTIVLVRVEPYAVPPVVMVDNIAWVRRGATTVRATEADMSRLRERRPLQNQPFDVRPWASATLDDLDTRELRTQYEVQKEESEDSEVFPTFEAWLSVTQLGASIHGVFTPNPAAILVYGKSPQSFFPGAVVEFVRYAGSDIDAEIVSRKEISGTLPGQLNSIWTQLKNHIVDIPLVSDGIRSSFGPEYPEKALKELARNLVQHRQYEGTNAPGRIEWYEDRIEFYNPGGPFQKASEGEFGTHSDYRNPLITEKLKSLGYVEKLGRGIALVRKHLERNGNPPLEAQTNGFTRLIVRRRS